MMFVLSSCSFSSALLLREPLPHKGTPSSSPETIVSASTLFFPSSPLTLHVLLPFSSPFLHFLAFSSFQSEIEAELAELEAQDLDSALVGLETPPVVVPGGRAPATGVTAGPPLVSTPVSAMSLPSAPTRSLETDEDRELAELEASMAM
jgi:hypothetical protein